MMKKRKSFAGLKVSLAAAALTAALTFGAGSVYAVDLPQEGGSESTVTVTPTPEVTPTTTPEVTPTATPEVTPTATPGDDATPTPEVTATATPNLFDFDEDTPRASKELTDPDTPKASATSKKTTTLLDEDVPLSDSAPETGDTTNLLFPMIVMGLSVLAIFGVIVFRKKMN